MINETNSPYYRKMYLEVADLADRLNLRNLFEHVLNTNPSANAPYHNNYHMMTVARNCMRAAEEMVLMNYERRSLFAAAMFHDYDHSAGVTPDKYNITKALAGFEWYINNYSHPDVELLDPPTVEACIRVTEYPFIYEPDPKSAAQQILRDADLMQMFEPTWVEMLLGLREEVQKKTPQRLISFTDMLLGQEDFMRREFKFYTAWGKKHEERLSQTRQNVFDVYRIMVRSEALI